MAFNILEIRNTFVSYNWNYKCYDEKVKTLSGVAKVEKADLEHCLRREGSFLTA